MKNNKKSTLAEIPFRLILEALPDKRRLLCFGIATRVVQLLTPVLFGYFITSLSDGSTPPRIFLVLAGVISLQIITILLQWASERFAISAFSEQERRLKETVWSHVSDMSSQVRDASSPGMWMQKFSRDVTVVQGACRILSDAFLGFSVFFFGTFMLVLWKTPKISLVFIAILFLTFITHLAFRKKIRRDSRRLRELYYTEGNTVFSLFEMLPVLKMFGVTHLFGPVFSSTVRNTGKGQASQQKTVNAFRVCMQMEIWFVHAAVLAACTIMLVNQHLAIGDVVMYDMLLTQMISGLHQIMSAMPQLEMGLESAKSLYELSRSEKQRFLRLYPDTYNSLRRGRTKVLKHPEMYSIQSVSFGYTRSKRPVIRDFSAKISAGEFVCFLGRNGTGKSTLAKLLAGIYSPEKGFIHAADPAPAMVPQRIVIYRDSLLENVRLFDSTISESTVEKELRRCGLGHFLNKLPDGIHSPIGPGELSGGELQTVGIARALVREPKTLILDELTNNLDIVAKEAIYEILNGLRGRCTIILVTHDISCLEFANRLFVFRENGISEIRGGGTKMRARKALKIIKKEAKS